MRYVRVVTRLRLYRDVLERVAASKSRARGPLRRVLGPRHHHSRSKDAIYLFPLAARMTSVRRGAIIGVGAAPVSYTHLTLPTKA